VSSFSAAAQEPQVNATGEQNVSQQETIASAGGDAGVANVVTADCTVKLSTITLMFSILPITLYI